MLMRGKKYPKTVKDQVLKEFESGKLLQDIAREKNIPIKTLKKWVAKTDQKNSKGRKDLSALKKENDHLKMIVADQALQLYRLKEGVNL